MTTTTTKKSGPARLLITLRHRDRGRDTKKCVYAHICAYTSVKELFLARERKSWRPWSLLFFFFATWCLAPPPLAAKFHYNSKAAHSCFQTRAVLERATTEKENGLLPFFTILCSLLFFFSLLLPFGLIKSWISSILLASFVKKKKERTVLFFYYTSFLFFF